MNRYVALVGLLALLISGTAFTARPAKSVSQSIRDGSTLSGSITWTASPTPSGGVSSIHFFIDGVDKWTEKSSPYQFNGAPNGQLDTTTLSNGSHTFRVTATWSRRATASDSETVAVSNTAPPSSGDTTPPTVSWAKSDQRTDDQRFTWETVTVTHPAADNVGVDHVDFFIDGAFLNTEHGAPYACVVDTTQYPNGNHTLRATAFNAAGNNASASITVSVQNSSPPPPPPPPPPPWGCCLRGTDAGRDG